MTINTYLESRPDKDGNKGIYFYISGNGKRSKIFSGIKIEPDNWIDGRIGRKETDNDLKNSIIQAKLSLLSKIVTEAELKSLKPDPDEVKREFLFRVTKTQGKELLSQKHGIINFITDYKAKYANVRKHGTLRAFDQVTAKIRAFDPDSTLEDMNQDWILRYCSFLVNEGLQDSTIKHRHLKSFKIIYKDAIQLGINVPDHIEKFKWKAQSKQQFFARWDEVEAIMNLDEFVFPFQEKVRDLFILSCFTGLRFSDLVKISRNNISTQSGQTMLRVVVVKTGFDYQIPLSSKVFGILQKYDFKMPVISNQAFNREIKHVAQRVVTGSFVKTSSSGSKVTETVIPRHKMFSAHTARRSFARHMLDKGASLIIVSKILGHSTTETTLIYAGYQPQEVVSEFQKVFNS